MKSATVLSDYCNKGQIEKASQYINNLLKPLDKVRHFADFGKDLCSIISKLLDNAIEACESLQGEEEE